MVTAAEMDALLLEVANDKSWHWKLRKGLFKRAQEVYESSRVSKVMEELLQEKTLESDRYLRALRASLEAKYATTTDARVKAAVGLLLGKGIVSQNGFHVPDLPLDVYGDLSFSYLSFPDAVSFCLSHGGVLQSAREAVQYRMMKGKDDLDCYYLTRTACIYFREHGKLFVAFDDDPFENILLSCAQEGVDSHSRNDSWVVSVEDSWVVSVEDSWVVSVEDSWVVSVEDSLIKNAILRAKRDGRIIEVNTPLDRDDALVVSRCILGDVSLKYDVWLKKQGYSGVRACMLTINGCRHVSEGIAEIRLLGVDYFYDDNVLNANWQCNVNSWARGAQKIWCGAPQNIGSSQPNVSTGNKGRLLPYMELVCSRQVGLYRDERDIHGMLTLFHEASGLSAKAKNVFYGGIGATRESLKTPADLQAAITAWVRFAPALAPIEDKITFIDQIMREPYQAIWFTHLDAAVKFFEYIASSRTKTKQFIITLKRIDDASAAIIILPFFIYLLEHRPKQLLDVLSIHTTLYVLEEGFVSEMEFLTTFAKPITAKEYDIGSLRNLTTPLNALDERLRSFFLKKLGVATPQGISQELLLENIDMNTASFTDVSYLLFSLLKNNDLTKAQKKLVDLQKKEQKLRAIIANITTITQLNEIQQKMLKATLQDISNQFFDIVFDVYTTVRNKKLQSILAEKFSCIVISPEKKVQNPSLHNALLLLKNLKGEDMQLFCRTIIQNYLAENTVPFKKPHDAYPWTLSKNAQWLSRHNKEWQEPFTQEYHPSSQEGMNNEDRIKHHLEDARRIITQLNIAALLQEHNIDLHNLRMNDLNTVYHALSQQADKHDALLLKDLKTQQQALNSLTGEQKTKNVKKIIIETEFDPLEILQMGNYVQGSCLAVNGSNKWSAVVNAIEANKRVLWAKDENNRIIARLLIAVDDNDCIVRFRVYYATNIKLDNYFDDYIKKLAQHCNLKLNGSANNVKNLIAKQWYKDPETNVE